MSFYLYFVLQICKFVKLMTIKDRFVGGNPQVLLLLFCLSCVILICFIGPSSNMMRKNEEN